MRTLWIIAGMRRSGIHAVLDWIRSSLDEPWLVLNNVRLGSVNPKDRNTMFSDGYQHASGTDEHLFTVFEDKRLQLIERAALLRPILPSVDAVRRLVVLRDPYNLTASRLHRTRHRHSRDTRPHRVAELWPSHASAGEHWTRCIYNRWLGEEAYRRRLADDLHMSTCPIRPEHVARAGRGSSFDGLKYDGRAASMAVLARWREYADDPEFRRLVDRPELARLSESVCHFPNPLEAKP